MSRPARLWSAGPGIGVFPLPIWTNIPNGGKQPEPLPETGEAVLGDEDRYGAYLDAMTIGKPRARLAVEQLRGRIEETRTEAASRVEGFLAAARGHMDAHADLDDAASDADIPVAEAPAYAEWRREAERLMEEGETILSDRKTYGPHLDNNAIGEERIDRALSDLRAAIRHDDEELAERQVREQRERTRQSAGLTFSLDTGGAAAEAEPARADTHGLLSRLRHVLDWDGRSAERDRQARIEADTRISLERWEELKRDWNRQVEQAEREGVHVIYTYSYEYLRRDLSSMAHDPYLDDGIRSEIDAALVRLQRAGSSRAHVEDYRVMSDNQVGRYRQPSWPVSRTGVRA